MLLASPIQGAAFFSSKDTIRKMLHLQVSEAAIERGWESAQESERERECEKESERARERERARESAGKPHNLFQ